MRWVALPRLVMLAIWLIATGHCRLAALPALDFLTCAHAHGDTTPDCDPPDGDDSCASVESGAYRSEDSLRLPLVPISLVELPETPRATCPGVNATPAVSTPATDPPRLVSWRFLVRAAAQPRAPSVLS